MSARLAGRNLIRKAAILTPITVATLAHHPDPPMAGWPISNQRDTQFRKGSCISMMSSSGFDEAAWDAALHREHGDLLQSWRWGEFKQHHGWKISRVQTPDGAMAQILFRQRGPVTIAYLPRGPVIAEGCPDIPQFLAALDEACARHRAITLVVEPDHPLPPAWTREAGGFVRGPESFQTSRTVKVSLTDDAGLLAGMHKGTRYNMQYAQRHGVTVERMPAGPSEIETFYGLLQETSQRHTFGIHTYQYYDDFMRIFGDQAVLLFSRANGQVTAGLIAARCGGEGRSMYAGSSNAHRVRGDAALLRFEAMQWTRDHGGTRYDLGGIAPEPRQSANDQGGEGAKRGSSLDGVSRFKVGFGGEIVSYPSTMERRYRPALAWAVRRFYPRFREAPSNT